MLEQHIIPAMPPGVECYKRHLCANGYHTRMSSFDAHKASTHRVGLLAGMACVALHVESCLLCKPVPHTLEAHGMVQEEAWTGINAKREVLWRS